MNQTSRGKRLDKYDKLRAKTKRIVAEGINISSDSIDLCSPKCASCLAAIARRNVDAIDFGLGFDSTEDVCMLDAVKILAKKLNWEVN